jgi:hypothetical protein
MIKKPKVKKKHMTIEDFARAIQADLALMATKDDLVGLASKEDIREIRGEFGKMREEMVTKEDFSAVSDRLAIVKEELQEQIAGLRYAKEIDALAERVKFVEQKLGIKHSRRAA